MPGHPQRCRPALQLASLAARDPALLQHHPGNSAARQAGEQPHLTPSAFAEQIRQALSAYDDEEILHWFKHAHGPIREPARRIAEALEIERPRTLQGVLAELAQEERLAGAIPFVAQMVSALSLPPRRLSPPELPLGGYSDVGTHGQPEQILPSQFALDDLEFVRRHAERELLYYRREEPQTRTREELVVLLDQGVRTWGTVRLVLTAALLAFGQLAERKRIHFRIASTSGRGVPHDPLQLSREELAELVQTSDLTANPALALERTLQAGSGSNGGTNQPGDIVLLTHPFNLNEPDLATAARRLGEGYRLFGLTVDAHGLVQLSELRGGAPLALSRFQVDLNPPRVPPQPASAQQTSWSGDVEPVGFPFRFGVEQDSSGEMLFAFDHSGKWLLTATGNGILHAWKTDGGHEVWPRGMIEGEVLQEVQAVLGVAGGFVVAGVVRGLLTAVYYDIRLRQRRVRAQALLRQNELPAVPSALSDVIACRVHWSYDCELHCVVVSVAGPRAAWDLGTFAVARFQLTVAGKESAEPTGFSAGERVIKAIQKAQRCQTQPPYLEVSSSPLETTDSGWLDLDERTGRVDVFLPELGRRDFTPQEDGQPALRGWQAIRAQFCGSTLALALTSTRDRKKEVRLKLYRLPDGMPLGDYLHPAERWAHVLSDDGQLLARQINPMQVEVRPLLDSPVRGFATARGGFHSVPLVLLGERWLAIQIDGRISHFVRWDQGTLVHLVQKHSNLQDLLRHHLKGTGLSLVGAQAALRKVPSWCAYDARRFQRSAWSNLVLGVDHFGQVFLWNHAGQLIAAFFAFQDQLAAWMPDGTCHGPEALLGRRSTPLRCKRLVRLCWKPGLPGRAPSHESPVFTALFHRASGAGNRSAAPFQRPGRVATSVWRDWRGRDQTVADSFCGVRRVSDPVAPQR